MTDVIAAAAPNWPAPRATWYVHPVDVDHHLSSLRYRVAESDYARRLSRPRRRRRVDPRLRPRGQLDLDPRRRPQPPLAAAVAGEAASLRLRDYEVIRARPHPGRTAGLSARNPVNLPPAAGRSNCLRVAPSPGVAPRPSSISSPTSPVAGRRSDRRGRSGRSGQRSDSCVSPFAVRARGSDRCGGFHSPPTWAVRDAGTLDVLDLRPADWRDRSPRWARVADAELGRVLSTCSPYHRRRWPWDL